MNNQVKNEMAVSVKCVQAGDLPLHNKNKCMTNIK